MNIPLSNLLVANKSSCNYNYFNMMNDNDNLPEEHVLKLDQFWPYQVTVLADRIARRTSKIAKAHNLNLSQWRVLAAIAEVPGRTSVEVVTITPMDKGIVSRATKALLIMGLVRREASQRDGRISHLHLTAEGLDLYQQIIPKVMAVLQVASTGLPQEAQAHLSEGLSLLMAALPDLR
jgi:DNA-binding MarR family transcriptional regulator